MKQFKRKIGISTAAALTAVLVGCTLPIGNVPDDPVKYEAVDNPEANNETTIPETTVNEDENGRNKREREETGVDIENNDNDNSENGSKDSTLDYSYADVIAMYNDYFAASKDPDFDPYENEDISMGVAEIVSSDALNNSNTAVGYLLRDISGDGNPELIIGTGYTDDNTQVMDVVLAIYGMTEEGPVRIVEGWFRNMFYIMEDNTIFNCGSSGAGDQAILHASLNKEGTELVVDEFYYSHYDYDTDKVSIYKNNTGEYTYSDNELTDLDEDGFYDIWDDWSYKCIFMEMTLFEK